MPDQVFVSAEYLILERHWDEDGHLIVDKAQLLSVNGKPVDAPDLVRLSLAFRLEGVQMVDEDLATIPDNGEVQHLSEVPDGEGAR
jgi:hypothetical protein